MGTLQRNENHSRHGRIPLYNPNRIYNQDLQFFVGHCDHQEISQSLQD